MFYLTGLAFLVLMIPLQLGRSWLSLGWLVEGVLLATYGIIKNKKVFKNNGLIIYGLCIAAFILFDFTNRQHYLFAYKYFAVTLGSITILGMYMYKKMMADAFARIYKFYVITNVWFYLLYVTRQLETILSSIFPNNMYRIPYLISIIAISFTFLVAYTTPRIKSLYDHGIKLFSMTLYVIGILWLFIMNFMSGPIHNLSTTPIEIELVGTFILIIIGLISTMVVSDLLKLMVSDRKFSIEWYPLITS